MVFSETCGKAALAALKRHRPDIVLADRVLPDMDGLTLLKKIKEIAPGTLVVIIAESATVDSRLEAIRAGAYEFISKPCTATKLRNVVGWALEQWQFMRDLDRQRDEHLERLKKHSGSEIVGTNDAIRKAVAIVSRTASTNDNVFISGEPGTESDVVARVIHANSQRRDRGFAAVNCSLIPSHLLELELFGFENGFEGPHRVPLLEEASGGTFFLEEITEISMDLQARLLCLIEEKCALHSPRLGEIPIDIRWISSSSRDLEQAVREGQLRQDLLDHLNVVPISLPALRQRREDIPAIAQHYLEKYSGLEGRSGVLFSAESLRELVEYPWPGNVHELQDVIRKIVSVSVEEQEITPADLPDFAALRAELAALRAQWR
jgi:two-component system, NtrC family, response regulator AtoC